MLFRGFEQKPQILIAVITIDINESYIVRQQLCLPYLGVIITINGL